MPPRKTPPPGPPSGDVPARGFVFHLRDGKIDRVHEYFDLDTARRVAGQKS
jgi:hypothetical protein